MELERDSYLASQIPSRLEGEPSKTTPFLKVFDFKIYRKD